MEDSTSILTGGPLGLKYYARSKRILAQTIMAPWYQITSIKDNMASRNYRERDDVVWNQYTGTIVGRGQGEDGRLQFYVALNAGQKLKNRGTGIRAIEVNDTAAQGAGISGMDVSEKPDVSIGVKATKEGPTFYFGKDSVKFPFMGNDRLYINPSYTPIEPAQYAPASNISGAHIKTGRIANMEDLEKEKRAPKLKDVPTTMQNIEAKLSDHSTEMGGIRGMLGFLKVEMQEIKEMLARSGSGD